VIASELAKAPKLERWVVRSETKGVKGRGTSPRPLPVMFEESTALEAAVLAYLETLPDAVVR
jgi:hypothetical protein